MSRMSGRTLIPPLAHSVGVRLTSPRLSLAVALAFILPAFAGCFGGDDPAPSQAITPTATNESEIGENAFGGLGAKETNATVDGVGGRTHIHDYWAGRQKVVVFDDVVYTSLYPAIPERDTSMGIFMARTRLPYGNLIYEGAAKIEMVVSQPSAGMPPLRMAYTSPDMDERSPLVPLPYDSPLELAVTPRTVDMPHSAQSLWEWSFYSDGTAKPMYGNFHLVITVYKGHDVEFWPGHPDFYKDKKSRTILENTPWMTQHAGYEDVVFQQGLRRDFLSPDLLVSMGTDRLVLFVNVTEVNTPFETGSYYLEFMNATRSTIRSVGLDIENSSFPNLRFRIRVDEGAHDSPYAEKSRWGFKLRVFTGAVVTCNTCFAYELKYTTTAIAYPPIVMPNTNATAPSGVT